MTEIFGSPDGYVQGRGIVDDIGEHVAPFGESAMLLADRQVLDIVREDVEASLEAAGVSVIVEAFEGECSTSEIERVGDDATAADVDVVIGAGGGKAIDTAKVVCDEHDRSLVSMPTIASTDAPCSAVAVLYTDDGEVDEYRFLDRHPDRVLVDTEIVASGPTQYFVAGIGDGLATWFEADATARAGGENVLGGTPPEAGHRLARLCYETIREHGVTAVEAVENDVVTDSVEAVVEANTLLSGLGFESGGLAAAHSIHNGLVALEATHGATHGEKVNVGTLTQLILEGREDDVIEDFVEFSADVGLPVTLDGIGLEDPTDDQLATVGEVACAEDETIHNEPFEVTPEMVADALRTADAIGRRARR